MIWSIKTKKKLLQNPSYQIFKLPLKMSKLKVPFNENQVDISGNTDLPSNSCLWMRFNVDNPFDFFIFTLFRNGFVNGLESIGINV